MMPNTADEVRIVGAKDSQDAERPTQAAAVKKYTAELLRMVMPLIAKSGSSFTPMSYAVWYEYVRGENTKVRDEVDALIDDTGAVDEPQTVDIYERHVMGKIERAIRSGQAELLGVLSLIDDSVEGASSSTTFFDSRLAAFGETLQAPISAEEMAKSVSSFQGELKTVTGAIESLQERLESSREEVNQLAIELSQAREEARIDPLSGLLNRRGFDVAMQDEMNRFNKNPQGTSKPLALVVFDIDDFKSVNDDHGHLVGDKVIQSLSRSLSNDVMHKDFAGRLGGEEFALLLPDTGAIGAMAVAERVRNNFQEARVTLRGSQTGLKSTVSGGIAVYRYGERAEEFLDRADKALYQAKQTGRNRNCNEA